MVEINKYLKIIILNILNKYSHTYYAGRPKKIKDDYALDLIFKVLRTGMQWKELNVINASYKTVYNRFLLWTKQNIFQQAYLILLNKYIESKKKWKKITSYSTDTTFIKNIFGYNCVGKNPTDRGRMASKISVIVDNLGIPFSLQMHEGNKNDCILLKFLIICFILQIKFYHFLQIKDTIQNIVDKLSLIMVLFQKYLKKDIKHRNTFKNTDIL